MKFMEIIEEEYCRICKGNLRAVLDLGEIYPSAFLKEGESPKFKAPLVLSECENCKLIQLKHTVSLDLMYRQYWYASSLNKSMVSSLKEIVDEIEKRIELGHDTVVDIGCNDGTLFKQYSNSQLIKIGYDPSINIGNVAKEACDIFINDYFSKDSFPPDAKKAKVITAIAMFYDLPDPNAFVEDVKNILAEDGIFVIQFTDLMSMIRVTAFDNICHEHLEYYRLEDVVNLLKSHNLEVIDVSYNNVNGGSIRITASHTGAYPVKESVQNFLNAEKEFLSENALEKFSKKIENVKFKVTEFLNSVKFHGRKIFLMGASTKGNTLLQLCNITDEQVPFAAEVNKDKFGLRTVGSNVKIISEEDALIKHPDYFLVPVWHFKDSLLKNPRILDYMGSGGKLVFPMPEFHVVYLNYKNEIKEIRI